LIRLSIRGGAAPDNIGMETPTPQIRRSRDRPTTPRLLRELRTLEKMAAIHCRDRHATAGGLCPECTALMNYAAKRLAVCPFGEDKPVCAKCQVHCYGPVPREQVRTIMRYAGPRMMLRHPWRALGHVLDKRIRAPAKPTNVARLRGPAPRMHLPRGE